MKTTCEDQRKVAESLRASTYSGEYLDRAIFKAIYGTMGEVPYPIGFVLADLIDPTCHMVDTDHEYEDSIRCDVCQMTFNRPWEPFKFCPNCGARVVDFTIRME